MMVYLSALFPMGIEAESIGSTLQDVGRAGDAPWSGSERGAQERNRGMQIH